LAPYSFAPGDDTGREQDDRLIAAWRHIQALLPGASPIPGPQPVYTLTTAEGVRDRFVELQRRLAPLGLLPLLRRQDGRPVLILIPKPAPGRWAWQTNALLFLATLATTFVAGYVMSTGLVEGGFLGNPFVGGLQFSASLLLILGTHEMGHKLVAVRRGIDASLPYFIPMIPPVGTMGAVIITRTPAPNRDSLMDLGASGPIAGFLAALPLLVYGLRHSFVIQPEQIRGLISYPDPLLVRLLSRWLVHVPPGHDLLMHPVLYAGWLGLFVTSLNLLPAGMLDGGHAVRSAVGQRAHAILSQIGVVLAVVMGAYLMAILMAFLIRRGHVGPLDDLSPMSPSRYAVGVFLIVIFVLSVVSLSPLPSLIDLFR
jgi:membrane-associated protease RseP (regulator of RpoE activity)